MLKCMSIFLTHCDN